MKDVKIDRSDDSMNDLSEIDRRHFFKTKSFIDESHLLNCRSIDWWNSIESDCCSSRNWKDENRCLIDSKNRCLIDWENDDRCLINSRNRCLIDWDDEDRCLINWDENRCLIDNFSFFRDWMSFFWVDRSRSNDSRADSDLRDFDRDCVCHE
jgi:hypothetical protein